MWRTIVILMILGLNMAAVAQSTDQAGKVDSLLQLLDKAKEDTNKVYLLHTIADQFETSEPAKARYYVGIAGELSRKLNFEAGLFKYYRHLSFINAYQSQYDSVLFYNLLLLDLAKSKKDTFNIGVSLFNIGEAYKFLSDYEKGLAYTLEAVHMLEGKGYTNIESNLYGGLQGTFLMLKQYDKAIVYGLKAVELGRKMEDKTALISAMVNLANCYGEIRNYTEAKKLYREAIEISVQAENKAIEAMAYEGLSDVALKESDFERLKEYAEKSLALHTATENRYGMMAARQALSMYYLYKKDFTVALSYANQALVIAETDSLLEGKAEVLNTLAAISYATGDFSNAIKFGDESKKITEKIFTESVAQKDAGLRVMYETEKKDSQLKLQQVVIRQKNTLNSILIGSAGALLLISLLSYRNYRQKQKLQERRITELEMEKQLMATEAVLKGEEQERTRLAKDLHDGLGGMLSGIKYSLNTMKGNLVMTPENQQAFERSMDMLDSSIKEMRRVAHNMMPESLVKFGLETALRDFCNDINQTGAIRLSYQSIGMEQAELDQTIAITLYRIVQELINNTMKHASARNAIVQLSKSGNLLSVTVEDDGKGFDTAMLKTSKGIGWDNIQNRVEFLKGKLDVDSKPGRGTSVHIELNT